MSAHSYEDSKKAVWVGLGVLALVTLIEVGISLFGGSMGDGFFISLIIGLLLTAFSFYKAYYIIFKFMHMADEAPGLRWTVLLPCVLLVWAIIAFVMEGSYWGAARENIKKIENGSLEAPVQDQSNIYIIKDLKLQDV